MALVAYGSSGSDSDSDDNDLDETPSVRLIPSVANTSKPTKLDTEPATAEEQPKFVFDLPAPRPMHSSLATNDEEEDDEFLHLKPIQFPVERPPPPPPVPKATGSGPVRIVLPALASFVEHKHKDKPVIGAQLPSHRGLLDMLPKPKSMQFMSGPKSTPSTASATVSTVVTTTRRLVPDSITRPKKPAAISSTNKPVSKKPETTTKSDSDDSDAEDFFALNASENDTLPEVSADEIAAMVANKSAQMTQAAQRLQEPSALSNGADQSDTIVAASGSSAAHQPAAGNMDRQAIEALCGSRHAKRARHGRNGAPMMDIIDISGDQVLPDRDEWMRTQLTAATEYQPRGLVDGDPGAGTKRKHQITYLAHQAKANEQELEAMWAANRHTKRQTQNKYGF